MSCPYLDALAMRPADLYNPYTTSSHEQIDNIINFAQFQKGDLV